MLEIRMKAPEVEASAGLVGRQADPQTGAAATMIQPGGLNLRVHDLVPASCRPGAIETDEVA
jgi:hypothetical protein